VACAYCEFLEARCCKDLAVVLIYSTDINQVSLHALLSNWKNVVDQSCTKRLICLCCNKVSCWERWNSCCKCTAILLPLHTTTVEDANILLTVDVKDPCAPSSEPVVLISVEDNSGVIADASLLNQLAEVLCVDDVAVYSVNEICVPDKLNCILNVATLVDARFGAYFDDTNLRVIKVCFQPIRLCNRASLILWCCICWNNSDS